MYERGYVKTGTQSISFMADKPSLFRTKWFADGGTYYLVIEMDHVTLTLKAEAADWLENTISSGLVDLLTAHPEAY